MHIPWQDCEVFIAVAELGSFSAAARSLRLTQPTVSRRIAALEDDLGRPLFRRDSEGTHLTREGAQLLPAAQQMARWANEFARAATTFEDSPTGVVRCAVPPGIAFDFMVPLAGKLADDLPDVRLELMTGVEHIDLTRGDAELAIRTRRPTQPELAVVGSIHTKIGVFAAPSLAERFSGTDVIDASALPWVTWSAPLEHVEPRPFLEQQLDPFHIAFASNSYLVLRRAVSEGLGAFILGTPLTGTDWWDELTELHTTLDLPGEQSMFIVVARSMLHAPRVRAVVERALDTLQSVDGLRVEANDLMT